ncbi:MAG TPA: formimidoylglutamate deiminase [Steroidobacteraceae bacterium]|nr:formimidoylglutamate deiminase [Steroidobacteraceae bacterium]
MRLPPESKSLFMERALLPDGWARDVRAEIAAGRFTTVTRNAAAEAGDERVAVALPGVANVHSHGFQRGMAGLTEYRGPEADNFWSWRELMYRFVGRMTPDDLEAVTALAYVEMLEGGFTRVGEFHYVHHDVDGRPYADPAEMATRVAAAARISGIGLTLLPVFYAHGNFGGAPPTPGQRRFLNDLDGYARLIEACRSIAVRLPDAHVGVAPHSLRAVTPEQLAAVTALAGTSPVHIHAAEQTREVDDCLAWSGARPVQWLLDHADLDARWCLVHATHLDARECAALARSGSVAGFCPVTEANLGDGIAPAAPLLAEGGSFGIGTDSNVSIAVRDELRQLEYSQRLRDRARNVLATRSAHSTGRTLFAHAVRGGDRAMGLGQVPVGIAAGAAADCVSLGGDAPGAAAGHDDLLLDAFIFAGRGTGIGHVWRAGRKVVVDGVHCARQPVEAAFRDVLARLLA